MIGGLFTTLFALLVVFSGRSMAVSAERQLTWNGTPVEPAFDHWGCCECNGVPDQCLGICFCDSNAVEDQVFLEHQGHCSKYVPEIGLCRNKCPNTTWKPPTTRRPLPTLSPSTAKPTTVHHNASKAKCARRLPKRTWTCAEETGPRTCCVKGSTGSTTPPPAEDCGDYGCLDPHVDEYDRTYDDY